MGKIYKQLIQQAITIAQRETYEKLCTCAKVHAPLEVLVTLTGGTGRGGRNLWCESGSCYEASKVEAKGKGDYACCSRGSKTKAPVSHSARSAAGKKLIRSKHRSKKLVLVTNRRKHGNKVKSEGVGEVGTTSSSQRRKY